MDLRQLEYFLAVAEHGGFTRAATALGITQPAISGQVRRLERELDTELFARAGRAGATLTPSGAAAVGPARAAVGSTEHVRAAVAAVTGLLTGRLVLGHVGSGATTTLAEPLAAFHRDHPGVAVRLVEDRSERLLAAVVDGGVDLAWVGWSGELPDRVEGRTVLDDQVVLAVPDGHELAGRRAVDLAVLTDRQVVTLPPGTGTRAALDRGLRDLGPAASAVHVAFECSPPDLIRALIEDGVGVGVLPEPLAEALGLSTVAFRRPALRSRLDLTWRTGGPSSPAARAFLSSVAAAG